MPWFAHFRLAAAGVPSFFHRFICIHFPEALACKPCCTLKLFQPDPWLRQRQLLTCQYEFATQWSAIAAWVHYCVHT